MENLPNCTCGAFSWVGGGGSFGPSYAFTSRECTECGARLHRVDRDGWWLALIVQPTVSDETFETYANSVLTIQARVYKKGWEAAVNAEEDIRYNNLVASWGLNPSKGCKYTPRKLLDENGTQIGWVEEEETHTYPDREPYTYKTIVYDFLDHNGNKIEIDTKAFRKAWIEMLDAHPRNPGIVRAPDPINLPEGITAYVLRNQIWEKTPPQAEVLPLPNDPLRMGWEDYFGKVFDAVWAATGVACNLTETPNQYYTDRTQSEPWYRFEVAGSKFTVGPRKRVISLEVNFPRSCKVVAIRDLALRDNTTYEANAAWKNEIEVADSVLVHAWTQDKLIEYLTILVRIATEQN